MDEQQLHLRIAELEESLRVSEHRNQELLRALTHVPSGIEIYDSTGLAEYLNPAMVKMTGLPSAEVALGRFNILTDRFSIETGLKPLYDCAYKGEIVQTEEFVIEMERASEDWGTSANQIWFKMVLVPLFDLDGNVESVFAIMFETTEARRLSKTQQLVSRRDGIELLAGGVAHDYNNLLTAIMTNSELVREISSEEEIQALNHDILCASQQAAFLTGQLLAYTGRNQRTIQTLDLIELTTNITTVFRKTLLQIGDLQLKMPQKSMLAEVDEGQYKQVVMNLLTNAKEALPEEGGTVTISLSQEELDLKTLEEFHFSESVLPGVWNLLEISDNGCGMSPDTRQRIFEPYFTTKSTGHGLGLAATLGIIWNHGGGISVRSTLGTGTSFKVALPLSAKSVVAMKPEQLQANLPATARVLLVDNSPYLRGSLRVLLTHVGFTVFEMEDGGKALEFLKAARTPPDLVLMDIMMPTLNGLDVLRMLRTEHSSLPVLLMSTHGEIGQRGVADDPFSAFIQKPFGPAMLLARIARMLSLSS